MKLFTKNIDKQLFAQYPKGGDINNQKVIAKFFNPYGRGRWYVINSDPNDPDYLWGIVELFEGEPEVGSFSRTELESLRVGKFKLPIERDLYFDPINALEVYNGLLEGKHFAKGGSLDSSDLTDLKKGDKITITFSSSIKKDNQVDLIVQSKSIVNKGKENEKEKITFVNSENPNGVKFYAYKNIKTGYVGFAQGDLAISNVSYVSKFAQGGTLKLIKDSDKNQGRLHYERFAGAIGSFAWIVDKRYNEGILYPLDEFDKEFYSHLKLKDGEMLFRYKTERFKSDWYFPLVKINLDKMLIYFLEDNDDKNPTFNSRGTKLDYLAIEEYYYEVREFAKGGELEMGIKTEMEEHGMDKAEATKTAKDHLKEHPNYYSKMKSIGLNDGGQLSFFELGGGLDLSKKNEMYEEMENFIVGYVESKYPPFKHYATAKSSTNFGESWYLQFGTYENSNVFKVRISDHGVGINRTLDGNYIYTRFKDSFDSVSEKIDDYINPASPIYEVVEKTDIFEGATIQRAIYPKNPDDVKFKVIDECIRKNKKGECIQKFEVTFKTKQVVGKERPKWKYEKGGLIAPNGKTSNLTPEQYKLVRTKAFKDWFGDWENDPENSSKVVDENGEPLVVYHGSSSGINIFKSKLQKNYFSPLKYIAQDFANYKYGENGKVYEVFLNLKNPKYFDEIDYKLLELQESKLNDGFIANFVYIDGFNEGKQYITLESNQIKLADGTNTTFDKNSDDIRYKKGGVTFDEKVSSIKRNLVGKKVPTKYKREYGSTYDKKEAEISARRIAGAMNKK